MSSRVGCVGLAMCDTLPHDLTNRQVSGPRRRLSLGADASSRLDPVARPRADLGLWRHQRLGRRGWGLTCSSSRVTSASITPSDSAGETTPEAAIAVFVSNPVVRLPAGGWERADFIATEQGTVPLTVSVPQAAFVRRDGDRIDMVLTLEQLPAGWQVTGAHQCAD